MTIETFQQPGALAASSPSAAVGSIVQWAGNLSTAAQAIRMIVDTPFMPLSFWPTPRGMSLREWPTPHLQHPRETAEEFGARRELAIASGAIAVCKGDEVGLTPQAALESIYVVRGKPGMYAEAMAALVKSHGHSLVVEELTDRVCRVRGRRRGEDEWQRFEFTIDRARRAGYVKQNPKYDNDPQTMLLPRTLSIAARAIAPDVLKGLRAVEEIEDEQDGDAPAPKTRTVQRAASRPELAAPAAPAPVVPQQATRAPSGPPLPGEDIDQAPTTQHEVGQQPADDPEGPISEKQWSDVNASFVRLGVTGPGQKEKRLRVISYVVSRTITRGGELTAEEGQLVLDNLAGDVGRRVVEQALASTRDEQPAAGPVAGAVEQVAAGLPALPGEDDLGGADPEADDEIDPTTDDDWGMDGAEAAAEGQ